MDSIHCDLAIPRSGQYFSKHCAKVRSTSGSGTRAASSLPLCSRLVRNTRRTFASSSVSVTRLGKNLKGTYKNLRRLGSHTSFHLKIGEQPQLECTFEKQPSLQCKCHKFTQFHGFRAQNLEILQIVDPGSTIWAISWFCRDTFLKFASTKMALTNKLYAERERGET